MVIISITIYETSNAQWVQTNGPEGITIKKFFDNDSVLFSGTSAKGAFRSYDHGMTWLVSNSGIENQEVFSFERDPQYLFAGTRDGVYRSGDNGITWTPANIGIQNLFVNCLIVEGGYLFAGTMGAGIYRSSDDGNTWVDANASTLNTTTIWAICYSDTNLIVEADNYVYKSSDYGNNWNQDQGPTQLFSISNFLTQGDTVIASAYGGIFYSYDTGNNWSSYQSVDPGHTFIGLASSNDTIYAGNQTGIYRSADYGITWNYMSATGLPIGHRSYGHFTRSAQNYLLGMDELGVFVSSDNGNTWSHSTNGFLPASNEDNSIIAAGNDLLIGTHSDGVFKTTDNGATYIKIGTTQSLDTLSNAIVKAVLNPFPNILIAATCDYGLYRSADNGSTWTHILAGLPPLSNNACFEGLAKSADKILAASSKGLYYSSDSGLTWSASNIPTTYHVTCISANGSAVVAGVSNPSAGVYRSTDHGVTFSMTAPISDIICSATDGLNYFYLGTFTGSYYSPDNGISWFAVGPGIPAGDPGFCVAAIGANVFIGNNHGVYYSPNNAASFTTVNQGLDPDPNHSIQGLAANATYIFAGTFRNAMWRRPLSDFGIITAVNQNMPDETQVSLYPNPATNRLNISSMYSNETVEILSTFGERIIKSEFAGRNFEIDISSLSNGIYFVKLTSEKGKISINKFQVAGK